MDKNELSVTIKSQSGRTWLDAVFNAHQSARHLLEKALHHFHLDARQQYEVLLVQGTGQRTIPLDESLAYAGVQTGETLLVRTVGRTVDG